MLTGPQEITLNRLLQGDTQREAAAVAVLKLAPPRIDSRHAM